ncbi:MAG: MgtC/SapB family protein [Gemmatimonadota bacterium]
MSPDLSLAVDLGIAAVIGLAVGLERERTGHTNGPDARFAGIRTFFLLGLLGGVSGHLVAEGTAVAAVALHGAGGVLAVVAYALAVRRPGATPDGTTETGALVVLALGALAGTGHRTIAAGAAAVVVAALVAKSRLQRLLLERIGEGELIGALQFAVLALVVLPLLPDRTWGPWGGVNPRELWIVVLIFAGVNYGGFVAHRWVGASRGYGAAGLLGGLVSSTAITLQFSRRSRDEPALSGSLGLGIVAACTVLLGRVAVVAATQAPAVALALVPYLALPFVVGLAVVGAVLWQGRHAVADGSAAPLASPLRLGSALQLALGFQVALFGIRAAGDWFGRAGVLTSAFVLGLTDMDALTFSMARLGKEQAQVELAARAIAVGIVANTLLKGGLVLALGTPTLRRVAGGGLAALLVATLVRLSWS